ncbi:MAG TPA: hypothetical protein PK225_03670 [Azonexus sp.]|nr:hypothetical protein [Azonexus sp.]
MSREPAKHHFDIWDRPLLAVPVEDGDQPLYRRSKLIPLRPPRPHLCFKRSVRSGEAVAVGFGGYGATLMFAHEFISRQHFPMPHLHKALSFIPFRLGFPDQRGVFFAADVSDGRR